MKSCIHLLIHLFIFGFTSCATHHPSAESLTPNQPPFTITMPEEWKQVTDSAQIKKHILWTFCNGNNTVWTEDPTFWAWDGPQEIDGFFTISAVKRDPTLGLGNWYDSIVQWLQQEGAVMQESGVTSIDGVRAKWWVQSLVDGYIYQQNYMLAQGHYLYTLSFTTTYVSPEKLAQFEQIAKTIRFR